MKTCEMKVKFRRNGCPDPNTTTLVDPTHLLERMSEGIKGFAETHSHHIVFICIYRWLADLGGDSFIEQTLEVTEILTNE